MFTSPKDLEIQYGTFQNQRQSNLKNCEESLNGSYQNHAEQDMTSFWQKLEKWKEDKIVKII